MTYSIASRDPGTGDLGVAVQSHWFAAGAEVLWARAGVGAVATQAMIEVSYGPKGLALMETGRSAPEALEQLLAADEGRDHRQVAMVDVGGNVAAHTGSRCMREAGHRIGDGYSAQANIMRRSTVWDAMGEAYARSAAKDLAHRLMDALDAAEEEGGDVRGRQAAGILVVRGTRSERPWEDTLVDLRVDDHPEPLAELRRLIDLRAAYGRLEAAEQLELTGDLGGALRKYQEAHASHPDHPEIAFWTAIALAGQGEIEEARRVMAVPCRDHDGWVELLTRLAADGFVDVPQETIAALLPGES
ncbi:MAG: DUF1028 domain-containing protein [Actinomycetota bacterium]